MQETHPSGHIRKWLGAAVVVLIGGIALWVLRRELHAYSYRDLAQAESQVSTFRMVMAFALTGVAYLSLAGYDALAMSYIGRPQPMRRTALGAFMSYAFSQTLGFPLLTGGAMRYRFWSGWGLSTSEIAQALSFASATFGMGVVAMAGVTLLSAPTAQASLLPIPLVALRLVGMLCVVVVLGYLSLSAFRSAPFRIREWEFPVPPLRLAAAQLAIAAADWALAGAVLYVLLPPGQPLGFVAFLGPFLLAQYVGLASSVPGGVGVFETLIVLLLKPSMPVSGIVAVLVAYRVIYYLVPFALALLTLAALEVHQHRQRVARVAGLAGKWIPTILPYALSVTVLLAGVVLLVSGVTPALPGRISLLDDILPLGVIELSHFLASVAGAGLILLAWAIRRRLDAAYSVTVALLFVGIIGSLLKGLDYEEAVILTAVLALLLPNRAVFYRRAALTSEPFSAGWALLVVCIVGGTTWLGFFAHKHVQYRDSLWWQFATFSDASRFLRATAGTLGALVVFAMSRLLRHAEADPPEPTSEDLERAAVIARAAPGTMVNLSLLGDKALMFAEGGDGMLMYGVEKRSWVSLGDPVGPPDVRRELAWRFKTEADEHGGWTVFYGAGADCLPLYIDLGLTLLKLGEEAVVPLREFSLDGGQNRRLRQTVRDVEKAGAEFEMVQVPEVPALLPSLRAVSDAWLAQKSTREKGFSLGRFDERYLSHFPMAVVRVRGEIVAFANVWVSGQQRELSVDLMRFADSAPPKAMEYLFVQLMMYGHAAGFERFSLGMAPLSGLPATQLAPIWARLGSLLYRHGEHFYNFQGLRRYKEKFHPEWEPRYIASPGGLVLPRILANVTSLISGGLRGAISR